MKDADKGAAASPQAGREPIVEAAPGWEELRWTMTGYTYWDAKREFLLETDKYDAWCLFAVESGAFAYGIGESSGTAGSGDLVLCPPSVPFRRTLVSEALTFHFALLRIDLVPAPNAGPPLPVRFTPSDRGRLFDSFAKWRRIGSLGLPSSYPLLSHYWNDIWTSWCLERLTDSSSGRSSRSAPDDLMAQAARKLEERYAEPYGVKQLSAELGLSPVQLIRRFRAAYRMTPGDYLTSVRIERACRLLRETRLTVDRIAAACGYASGYYLSRLFAARVGLAPSEYRKRHRL
ncbi:helix-turn-helix domain-containing protein [Paenibacillus flagellatus]|nr:AraC family transcriptional regulator [Paenibacillus flagellatus]